MGRAATRAAADLPAVAETDFVAAVGHARARNPARQAAEDLRTRVTRRPALA